MGTHLLLVANLLSIIYPQILIYPYLCSLLLIEPRQTHRIHQKNHRRTHSKIPILLYQTSYSTHNRTTMTKIAFIFLNSNQRCKCPCRMLSVDLILELLIIAGSNTWLFVVEVDEFKDIGVVDGCPFDEETVVIREFFLVAGFEFVGVDEFLGDGVFIGVGIELLPVFGEQVEPVVSRITHICQYHFIILNYITNTSVFRVDWQHLYLQQFITSTLHSILLILIANTSLVIVTNLINNIATHYHNLYADFIGLQYFLSAYMQNQPKTTNQAVPKRIVDFKLANQHEIFYLVIWDEQAKLQEWVQDTYLVGCQKLIQNFFTSIEQDQENELQIQDGYPRGKKKPGQPPNPHTFKWNIDCSRLSKILNNKTLQKRIKLKGEKKRQKKYINDDIRLLLSKIDSLDKYIDSQRPAQHKLDYLLNFVVNVFKKGDTPYFTVRTFHPERNLSVSLQHMQRYFPQTLKDYYRGILKLHTRKMMQSGGQKMVEEGQQQQQSSEEEDSAQFSSKKSAKMRSGSQDSGSKGFYEEMSD